MSVVSNGPPPRMPALLISTSHRSNVVATRSRSSGSWSSSVTSQPTARAERPPEAISAGPTPPAGGIRSPSPSGRSSRRAGSTTRAPARPNRSAVSSPKPDDAPVMTTTDPRSSTSGLLSGRRRAPRTMGSMDVIGSHAARLPALDDRWTPRAVGREELTEGLRSGAVAGPEISHPLDNVLRNIRLLHEGDPDKQFGMTGLQTLD